MDTFYPYLGWVFIATSFLVLTLFAAFFQRQACGICGEGLPTFKRAIFLAAFTLLATYIAWDFSGYFIVRFSKEAFRPEFREMIHKLTYGLWFQFPLSKKVEVIAWVPMVNKLPYLFALCISGICTVVGLTVTFRTGLLILVLQGIMTLTAFAISNFLFGFATHFLVSKFPKEAAAVSEKIATFTHPVAGLHGYKVSPNELTKATKDDKVHNILIAASEPKASTNKEKSTVEEDKESQRDSSPNAKILSAAYTTYLETNALSAGYLDQINRSLEPISAHLPEKVRNFLESGGWWFFIGLAVFLIINWIRKVLFRVRKRLKKKKTGRFKPKKIQSIKLAEMPPAPSTPGNSYLTVKNIPGRIRVIIMCPAGSEAGELHWGMAETVADHIKSGLGSVVENDLPLVEIWNRQFSSSGFPFTFFSNVVSPDSKGEASNWARIAGLVSLGKFKVHVGMAVEFMERNSLGQLEIKPDKWLDTLDVKQTKRHQSA
jgi:hypothetical protein